VPDAVTWMLQARALSILPTLLYMCEVISNPGQVFVSCAECPPHSIGLALIALVTACLAGQECFPNDQYLRHLRHSSVLEMLSHSWESLHCSKRSMATLHYALSRDSASGLKSASLHILELCPYSSFSNLSPCMHTVDYRESQIRWSNSSLALD